MDKYRIKKIIGCFAFEAFKMHPYNNPPHMEKIVEYLKKKLSTINDIEDYSKLRKTIKIILMDCLYFRQFNISKSRWEQGQRDIYDEDNYKSNSNIPQENDFIDLDALIQNLIYTLSIIEDADNDCFLCKYAKEYGSMEPSVCKECQTCINNPNYKSNYCTHSYAKLPVNSNEYQELIKSGKIKGMER